MKTIGKEFEDCLMNIKHFIGRRQVEALKSIYQGEERSFALEVVKRLSEIITVMPNTYESDCENQQILHLHYFYANCDWYIIEKDCGNSEDDKKSGLEIGGQYQAFGYANLGDDQNAEFGYISIKELIEYGAELDFHFTPITYKQLKSKK